MLDTVARAGFTATCDQPTADIYAEKLRKYPDAKAILIVRDNGRKWVSSWKVLVHVIEVQERPAGSFSGGMKRRLQAWH